MGKRSDTTELDELLNEPTPTSRLEKPLVLNDFINKCSDFTIHEEDEIERNEEMDITQIYSVEELEPYCLPEVLEPPSDDDNNTITYDETSKSFPLFRKKMKPINYGGKVMKLIYKESVGEKVPRKGKFVVYIHYSAYVEFVENPFDCTKLRNRKPVPQILGDRKMIPGLEIAIRSMRRWEKAKFLVHPDLAYREAGVPPRIPPQSTILFDVELFDFSDDVKNEELEAGEKTFAQSLEMAMKFKKRGTVLKLLENNLSGAISAYRKGLQVLLGANLSNDNEEIIRKKELMLLYSNLAICYLNEKRYKRVCSMFNDARQDCSPLAETNIKLLYNSSKALRMLGSYDEAEKRLKRAIRLEPGNAELEKELAEVKEARKNDVAIETRYCHRMFAFVNPADTERCEDVDETIGTVTSDFKEVILEILDGLITSSNKKEETLDASEFTYAEKQTVRKICAEKNLLFKSSCDGTIVITKTAF